MNHTLVVSADGMMVWAFGDGDYGKLGLGNSTAKSSPQVGAGGPLTAVRHDVPERILMKVFFQNLRKWTFYVESASKKWRAELSFLWR